MNTFSVIILGIVLLVVAQAGAVCNTTVCDNVKRTNQTDHEITSSEKRPGNYSVNVNITSTTQNPLNSTESVVSLPLDANNTQAQDVNLKNRLNTIGEKCKKEIGAQQEILAIMSSKTIPTNEKQRCFLECVYKDLGLIKDNKLNAEGATALAKQVYGSNKDKLIKADELLKKCKVEVVVPKGSTERCILGRLIRSCVVNHGGELQLFTKNN